MWPKMLLELLPHLSRLVPLWEKFLAGRQAADRAQDGALAAMAEAAAGVREDLAQVTAAHASLYRQMQVQDARWSGELAALGTELRLAREAAGRAEAMAQENAAGLAALGIWVKAGVIGVGFLMVGVVWLLVRRG